jgi:hypothetical protein
MVTKYIINNLPSQTITGDLNISEKTVVTSFQMTSGATDGYVLTSDVDGNGTWQVLAGGGNTIDEFYIEPSTTSFTWDISGNSTNYKIILTGNTTIDLNNVRNGDYGTLIIQQDVVGGYGITLGNLNGSSTNHLVVGNGSGTLGLTGTPNSIDILSFVYDGTNVYWNNGLNYT